MLPRRREFLARLLRLPAEYPICRKEARSCSPRNPRTPTHRKSLAAVPKAVIDAEASYAGVAIKPAPYDPAVAKAAIDASRPRLKTPLPEQLTIPRLDVRAAALAAIGVHAFATQVPGVFSRFQKQASIGEFDLQNLEDLKSLAFGILYAHAQAESAGVFRSDAKVPLNVVTEVASDTTNYRAPRLLTASRERHRPTLL